MATAGMKDDTFLQAGLSSGMSATEGFHSNKPKPAPAGLAGKNTLPQSVCPGPRDRTEIKGANGQTIKASPGVSGRGRGATRPPSGGGTRRWSTCGRRGS